MHAKQVVIFINFHHKMIEWLFGPFFLWIRIPSKIFELVKSVTSMKLEYFLSLVYYFIRMKSNRIPIFLSLFLSIPIKKEQFAF